MGFSADDGDLIRISRMLYNLFYRTTPAMPFPIKISLRFPIFSPPLCSSYAIIISHCFTKAFKPVTFPDIRFQKWFCFPIKHAVVKVQHIFTFFITFSLFLFFQSNRLFIEE